MSKQTTDHKTDYQPETSALMAAYNPEPPQAERPKRFYWQGPCEDCSPEEALQQAFES